LSHLFEHFQILSKTGFNINHPSSRFLEINLPQGRVLIKILEKANELGEKSRDWE